MPPNFCYFYLLKIYYVSSVFYYFHFRFPRTELSRICNYYNLDKIKIKLKKTRLGEYYNIRYQSPDVIYPVLKG